MNNLFNNVLKFDFGPVTDKKYVLAITGQIAIKTKQNQYVYFDKTSNTIMEVGDMTFDFDQILYKLPVQQVEKGDLIEYNGTPVLVESVDKDGIIRGINPVNGSKTRKIQRTNMFGMYFYTKIVSMFDMQSTFGGEQGGFNPMLLMLMDDKKSSSKSPMTKMLLLSQMMATTSSPQVAGFDPTMLLLMDDDSDIMQTMLLSQMLGGGASPLGGLFGKPAATPQK